jgi:hypothetical protein
MINDEEKELSKIVVPCPYCPAKESSTIREVAIKKVVQHSIRKHPGRAVVAALQKAGFEYKEEKDKKHLLSEEKYYDDDRSSSGVRRAFDTATTRTPAEDKPSGWSTRTNSRDGRSNDPEDFSGSPQRQQNSDSPMDDNNNLALVEVFL